MSGSAGGELVDVYGHRLFMRTAAGEGPLAAVPPRLPVELLRLAPPAGSAAPSTSRVLRLPRLRAVGEAARPRLLPVRASRSRRRDRGTARHRPGRAGGTRHGHLGRHRAAGAGHRGAAAVSAALGPAPQREHGHRARQPDGLPEGAAQPVRRGGGQAQQRALVPGAVRAALLPRPPAHARGGRRPVVAARLRRRQPDPRTGSRTTCTSGSPTRSAGTARCATGAGSSSWPGRCAIR